MLCFEILSNKTCFDYPGDVIMNSCLCGDDEVGALGVRRRCKQLLCSPLVCVCVCPQSCVIAWNDMWPQRECCVGSPVQSSRSTVAKWPLTSDSSICCSSVTGCNLCLAPYPAALSADQDTSLISALKQKCQSCTLLSALIGD